MTKKLAECEIKWLSQLQATQGLAPVGAQRLACLASYLSPSRPATNTATRLEGKLKFHDEAKGFGFIIAQRVVNRVAGTGDISNQQLVEATGEVYVASVDLLPVEQQTGRKVHTGQCLSFEVQTYSDGKCRAQNVQHSTQSKSKSKIKKKQHTQQQSSSTEVGSFGECCGDDEAEMAEIQSLSEQIESITLAEEEV